MLVYIVVRYWRDEIEQILYVFTDRAAAQAECDSLQKNIAYDFAAFKIEVRELITSDLPEAGK